MKDNNNDRSAHDQGLRHRPAGSRAHGRRNGRPRREAGRRFGRCTGQARYHAGAAGHRGRRQYRRLAARDRGKGGAHHRPPPADGGRSARSRRRAAARQRSRAHRRSRQEHRQARDGAQRRIPAAQADPRRRAHDRSRAPADEAGARCLWPPRRQQGDGGVARRRGNRRGLHLGVPRAAHLYDGRSAQYHLLHPSDVLRQEHRAHGRPRHQHRGNGPLHHRRAADRRSAAERRHHDHRRAAHGRRQDNGTSHERAHSDCRRRRAADHAAPLQPRGRRLRGRDLRPRR